jgi:hypothetical protein
MTDDEQQTDPEDAVDAGGATADAAPDEAAGEAAAAAAAEASETQIEDVKAGEPPPKALATPHGHEGDYDPVAAAEDLPDPPPEAEAEGDDGDDAADEPAADAGADAGGGGDTAAD